MTSPETKLKRFLHFAREQPLYQPGRSLTECFSVTSVTAVEALIADGKDPVPHILKVLSDGYSVVPESLVYVLALCARQQTSAKLRTSAFDAVKTVCKTASDLFLFVKFTTELSAPTTGFGRGMRRAVSDWYTRKEPKELAVSVSGIRSRYGWTHKDLIKLSHIKTTNPGHSAVLLYLMKGLAKAREIFGEAPEAQEALSYLAVVDDVRSGTDPQQVARLVEMHSLTPDHIPSPLHGSREVWAALVPQLPLPVLLVIARRLTRHRVLRGSLVGVLEDALEAQEALAESSLHPAEVLVALSQYQALATPTYILGDVQQTGKIKPPKPNPKIIDAMKKLLDSTFKLLVPTGLRYVVAVDIRVQMIQSKCWHCSSLPAAHAAAILALSLVRAERDVVVLALGTEGPVRVELGREDSLDDARSKLVTAAEGTVELSQGVLWAKRHSHLTDAFVLVTDNQVKPGKVRPAVALQQYRTKVNQPGTKLVTCAVSCSTIFIAQGDDPGMLDIAGFDGKVPRLIEAFCRGAF